MGEGVIGHLRGRRGLEPLPRDAEREPEPSARVQRAPETCVTNQKKLESGQRRLRPGIFIGFIATVYTLTNL